MANTPKKLYNQTKVFPLDNYVNLLILFITIGFIQKFN